MKEKGAGDAAAAPANAAGAASAAGAAGVRLYMDNNLALTPVALCSRSQAHLLTVSESHIEGFGEFSYRWKGSVLFIRIGRVVAITIQIRGIKISRFVVVVDHGIFRSLVPAPR